MMKRILAFFMCLTLVFSSANVAFAAENLGNEVAEEQMEVVEETKAATDGNLVIHFKNTWAWNPVN